MLRTFVLVLLLAVPASAQCTQKIATLPSAPELFGFRLGMTKDEIKQLVPQTVFPRDDHFGVAKTTINPHFDPKIDQVKYNGVRSISLDLLDDKLTSLWIGYDENFKVQTVDDFVKLVIGSLQVSGPWSSWKSRGQQIRCADFQLIVSTLAGGPSLRIVDLAAEDTIAARRQAKEEQDAAAEAAAAEKENGETDSTGNNAANQSTVTNGSNKPNATNGGSKNRTIKTNSSENGASETSNRTTETSAATPAIIGDRQTKTYYPNGCQPAKQISETNRVIFKTAADAQTAGFKLAKNCH
ncbi:MAG TPA: hypothetical protein VJ749_03900 [Pyrinomonadaceae bacterium]|nr:hypothetical protein [Pyrinomonadaceae bacterium]